MNRSPRSTLLLAVATLGCGAGLAAQNFAVSPPQFATVESNSSNDNPLGATSPLVRYLQIDEELPPQALAINGIAFRGNASPNSYPLFRVDLDLRVSIPNASAANPSPTFNANHGRTGAMAVARRFVSFPGRPASRSLPLPFDYQIPFDAPFTVNGAICWEMKIYGRGNSSGISFDAIDPASYGANPTPAILSLGSGCIATGRTSPMAVAGTLTIDWPNGNLRIGFGATQAPANALCLVALGFSSSQWAGLPLPLAIPGSESGSSGRCFVQNELFTTIAGNSNAAGIFFPSELSLPLAPSHHGLAFFHHVVAFDAAANPFGVVTSNGMARQLIAPAPSPGISRVAVLGSHQTTGIVNVGSGLVTRYGY